MKEVKNLGEIIPIQERENGTQAVSARTLHTFFGVSERFQSWFERMVKYGFVENEDFLGCKFFNTQAKQELQDYAVTLDMAKELCMLQRNEKGRTARHYFIECEKRAKAKHRELSRKELALMVIKSEEEKERLMLENQQKDCEIERQNETIEMQSREIKTSAPKVQYFDDVMQSAGNMTTRQVGKMIGMNAHQLHLALREAGVLFLQSGQWQVRSPYDKWGLHDVKLNRYDRSDGSDGTRPQTVWTQKGVRFINLLNRESWNLKEAVKKWKLTA